MSRLKSVSPENAVGEVKALYGNVEAMVGRVPSLYQALGNSPATLKGVLGILGALSSGRLTAKERTTIALAVAELNSCGYCLSAHTAFGKLAGMTDQQTCDIRFGKSNEPNEKALVDFAAAFLANKGSVSDRELDAVRAAGFDDERIGEIVLTIALNYFTTTFNLLNQTDIDFPVVTPKQKVAV